MRRRPGLARRVAAAAAPRVLAVAVIALDAERARAVGRRHDDRVEPIDLAGPAEVFDGLSGAERIGHGVILRGQRLRTNSHIGSVTQ